MPPLFFCDKTAEKIYSLHKLAKRTSLLIFYKSISCILRNIGKLRLGKEKKKKELLTEPKRKTGEKILERKRQLRRSFSDKCVQKVMLIAACFCILVVALITVMIFKEGLPIYFKTGVFSFLFGTEWAPTAAEPLYGILPMIVGTVYTTLIGIVIGVPIGLGTAIFLAEFAPPRLAVFVRKAIEILAGIPSVVFGFFGLVIIVPFVRSIGGGAGMSVLAAGIILAIMILPTIITISEVAIRSVPKSLKAGSLAMGASEWQTITRVTLPTARSGIITSIVLGIGRAVGETMAIILVAGNTPIVPVSLFDPTRTMTVNIVLEMSYVRPGTEHYAALFGTGVALFVFIMILNLVVTKISKKGLSK